MTYARDSQADYLYVDFALILSSGSLMIYIIDQGMQSRP